MQQDAWQPRQKGAVCFDDWKRADQTIQLARQIPPTTDGKRTTTAWSQTGFQEDLSQKLSEPLVETMPQSAWMTPHLIYRDVATHANDDTNRADDAHDHVDDMEMVETTSTDDELEIAWTEDSDDSADEDP